MIWLQHKPWRDFNQLNIIRRKDSMWAARELERGCEVKPAGISVSVGGSQQKIGRGKINPAGSGQGMPGIARVPVPWGRVKAGPCGLAGDAGVVVVLSFCALAALAAFCINAPTWVGGSRSASGLPALRYASRFCSIATCCCSAVSCVSVASVRTGRVGSAPFPASGLTPGE